MSDNSPHRSLGAPPSYRPSRGLDRSTRNLLIAAAAVLALLLILVGGWSLSGRHPGSIPVIHADSQPLRVKPDNPGGLEVAGANEQTLNDTAGQTATMTPSAEAPAPQALRAQLPSPAPLAPAPPAPAPLAAAEPEPAARPAPAPAVAAPAPAPTPVAASPGALVQLAALTTEESARTEWQRLQKRYPDLLGAKHPVIQRAEHDGKPVWRLRLGGFTDVATATRFCVELRAKRSACQLATF